ncbi:hypothetical protein [Streptomyces hainanensis]|uniref:Uncharacterized protein n=1 Tax=Streptomyces hainanensis TaxID=402648 RepID=A0A4V2Y3F7_9ACTN|nr:hypothetical protein [Streptomyces hainanensis]TDC76325.1 hypothetical protein E1283_10050 [Streptomyces hainanensis]
MSAAEHYGTFPEALDELLDSMGEGERNEVVLLTWPESEEFYGLSLRRFSVTSWGALDWDAHGHLEQVFIEQWAEAERRLADLVQAYTETDSLVVVMWGNLTVPSIALPARSVKAHAAEVLAASDDIWLFAVDEEILIEYQHDGRFTVARVPGLGDPVGRSNEVDETR